MCPIGHVSLLPMCPISPVPHCPYLHIAHRPHCPCGPYPLYPIAPISWWLPIWPITQWGAGVMGNVAHGAIVYRGYGVQGYRPHGPWGLWAMGAQGVWGTGVWAMGYRGMGPMGNGAQGVWGTRVWATWAMGYRGYGAYGQWGPLGVWVQGVWGTRGMGHVGKGIQGYGQWGPWAICSQNIKKMSSCQKNVKCQKIKHLDYGGGSQKIKLTQWGSQILTSILMSQMMVTKNPQNVLRKYFWAILMMFISDDINMCEPHYVNLFFLWTSSIVQMFDYLTSFWQLDILTHNLNHLSPLQGYFYYHLLPGLSMTAVYQTHFSQIPEKQICHTVNLYTEHCEGKLSDNCWTFIWHTSTYLANTLKYSCSGSPLSFSTYNISHHIYLGIYETSLL